MLNPDYKEMLSAFLEEGVDFVLVGAYALAVHGFPRATGDIDILNEITGVSYESATADKIIVEIEGLKIPVISKKKLIQNKESTGRDKDALDARKLKGS